MNNVFRSLILPGVFLLSPLVASAHPGHGPAEVSPGLHPLLSPEHLGMALVAVVTLFCVGRAGRWMKSSP